MSHRLPVMCLRYIGLSIASICIISTSAFAHEGHDKAPGEDDQGGPSGPVVITAEAKKNLGLVVDEAQIRPIDKTLMVIGQIEAIPNRSAAVSSRISGRVLDVKASDGDNVKKGQVLVEVESRQLGDPPPRAQYAAPIDGVVTDRHVVTGDNVEPDKHLLEIVNLDEVYAEGRIYEGQVSLIKSGQLVRVGVESYPDEVFQGVLELISGALDPETRTLRAWIRVKNPDDKLKPNMRATLNIITAQSDAAISVPHSAVLDDSGNFYVFVQSDTNELSFERRPVVTGIKDDRFVEIVEGVFPGDKVVTIGNYQLQYIPSKTKPEAGHESSSDKAH